jgi:rhodanese-related sulfurtransferase
MKLLLRHLTTFSMLLLPLSVSAEERVISKDKKRVFWCSEPACGQSPRAIKGLLKTGYPSEQILYYRGGMQMWQLWGLTTVMPGV